MSSFKSDVKLGEVYRDEQTGFEGTATGIFFYQHGCERVSLETRVNSEGKIINEVFDAPRLTHKSTRTKVTTKRTGGPAKFGENVR